MWQIITKVRGGARLKLTIGAEEKEPMATYLAVGHLRKIFSKISRKTEIVQECICMDQFFFYSVKVGFVCTTYMLVMKHNLFYYRMILYLSLGRINIRLGGK